MSIGAIIMVIAYFYILYRTMFDPFYGILGYYFLTLLRPQDVWSYTFLAGYRLSFYLAGLTIICALLRGFKNKMPKEGRYVPIQSRLFFVFFIGIFMSYIFSYNREISWNNYVLMSKIVFFYYIAYFWICENKQFRLMLWVVVISTGYLAVFANDRYFLQHVNMPIFGPGSSNAAYNDNNIFCMIFVIGLPFCYYMAQLIKIKFIQISLYGLMLVMLHAVILTNSRGGFLGLIAASAMAIVHSKKKGLAIFVGCVSIMIFFQMWGTQSRERMSTIFVSSEERDASSQGRLDAWAIGFRMFRAHPLTGVGLDMYEKISPRFAEGNENASHVAHNAYIQMLVEGGIISGGALILMVFISIFDLFKIRTKAKKGLYTDEVFYYSSMLFSSFFGYAVSATFLSLDTFEPMYFLILLTALLKKMIAMGKFNVISA